MKRHEFDEEGFKIVPVRIDCEMYRRLKKLSHLTEKPMSRIVRDSVIETLNEYKKILTNSDIAI